MLCCIKINTMKPNFLKILILIIAICDCCEKDKSTAINLIKNPSFEINGQPTTNFWEIYKDIDLPEIDTSAPKGGGLYSLQLVCMGFVKPFPQGGPTIYSSYASTIITNIDESGTYELSFWMKVPNNEPNCCKVEISKIKNSQNIYSKSHNFYYTMSDNWDKYSCIDTLQNITTNDSIIIKISVNTCYHTPSSGLFDLISFRKVN
jgi:hypothetical protein